MRTTKTCEWMIAHDRGYTPVCLERPCGAWARSYGAITTLADVIVGVSVLHGTQKYFEKREGVPVNCR